MSRIGRQPVVVPKGVKVTLKDGQVSVKGPKGQLHRTLPSLVNVEVGTEEVVVTRNDDAPESRSRHGLVRALINNMVVGVSQGFEKKLDLIGVGYRGAVKGSVLNLTLGFSHPVNYQLPEGVSAEMPSQTSIVLKAADKQKLGQAAAEIRAFRPPEPYKGKGVRYSDEHVRRKEAKKK